MGAIVATSAVVGFGGVAKLTAGYTTLVNVATSMGGSPLISFSLGTALLSGACGSGSGGLTLAKHLDVPFVQEVIAVSTALQDAAPQTDVAIELGGEDAKIIYFEGGNVEQRMNGICAGGTGSFIDQMASLIQADASGLDEYAKNYKAIYPIAARCGVFAKTDIQPVSYTHLTLPTKRIV